MAASLATVKLLLKSVVSTNDSVFITADTTIFSMPPSYQIQSTRKCKLKMIPQEIIDQYNLQDLQENGWVYMKIVKGVDVVNLFSSKIRSRLSYTQL